MDKYAGRERFADTPWEAHAEPGWVHESGGGRRYISIMSDSGQGYEVARVWCDEGDTEMEANLHLILAAPSLLDACRRYDASIKRSIEIDGENDAERELAETMVEQASIHRVGWAMYNAVAKAEGRLK